MQESLSRTVTVLQAASPDAEPFVFELGEVTHNSASVIVAPADQSIDYLVMYMTEEEFEKGYATDDQIYEQVMTEFAYAADALGYDSMREYFENEIEKNEIFPDNKQNIRGSISSAGMCVRKRTCRDSSR